MQKSSGKYLQRKDKVTRKAGWSTAEDSALPVQTIPASRMILRIQAVRYDSGIGLRDDENWSANWPHQTRWRHSQARGHLQTFF